jgi:hypothetical protein
MNNRSEENRPGQQTPHLTDEGLPVRCPSWCIGDHERSLIEGNVAADARVHQSIGFGDALDDLTNPFAKRLDREGGGGWEVVLSQDEPGHYKTVPTVDLECRFIRLGQGGGVDVDDHVALHLTTGEARSLAAQLVHLADLGDLS